MEHKTWNRRKEEKESRVLRARYDGFSSTTPYTLYPKPSLSAGFTLVEMIVSIALFSFVMVATASVLLSVVDANHKAQGLKTAIYNISLTMESMARNIRVGTNYHCGVSSSNPPPPNDCSGTAGNAFSFLARDGSLITYGCASNPVCEAITVSKNGATASTITAPEIKIDRLDFYVDGSANKTSGDTRQPRVLIVVGGVTTGVAGGKQKTSSRFDLQTLVSQRLSDAQ